MYVFDGKNANYPIRIEGARVHLFKYFIPEKGVYNNNQMIISESSSFLPITHLVCVCVYDGLKKVFDNKVMMMIMVIT